MCTGPFNIASIYKIEVHEMMRKEGKESGMEGSMGSLLYVVMESLSLCCRLL